MRTILPVLAVLLACGPACAATVSQDTRVVLMGDSEAFLLAEEFPILAKATGARFSAVPVPGSSVISWGTGLPGPWRKVRSARPDVLLVSLGANDACTGPSVVVNERPFLSSFRAKLDRTHAKCVVWLGPPAIGAPRPTRSQCAAQLAGPGTELFSQMIVGAGIPYIDARTIRIELWDDHLHCSRPMHPKDTSRGCETWATWVWQRLTTEDLCTGDL